MHLNFEKDLPDLNRFKYPRYEENSGLTDFDEIQEKLEEMRVALRGEDRGKAIVAMTKFIFEKAAIEVRECDPFGVNIAGWEPGCERYPWRIMQKVILQWEQEIYESDEGRRAGELRQALRRTGAGWAYPDNCHSKPNWDDIFALGLPGIIDRAKKYRDEWIARGEYSEEKRSFYESVIEVYEAFIVLIGRFADCADKKAARSPKMADLRDALRSIASGAPQNLYEVMLLTFVYSLVQEYVMGIQARTLGHIDTLWRPYYERALADGSMTRAEVKELLKYFFMQYEMEANRNNQPIALAGTDGCGRDLTNELSYLMMEAYGELSIISPKVQIAVAESTPDEFLKLCCDLIRKGHSSIVFVNEEAGRAGQKFFSADPEDAKMLSLSGCYNFSLKENVQPESVGINFAKGVELVLYGGRDPGTGIELGVKTPDLSELDTFEKFYAAYMEQNLHIVDVAVEVSDFYDRNFVKISPAPMLSGNFDSAVRQGKDVYFNGAKYHNTVITVSCIASAVDSLYAVKKYVYDEGRLTLAELRDVLAANWSGHEELRCEIARDGEKYGNNIDKVDAFAVEIMKKTAEHVYAKRTPLGQSYAMDGEGIDHGITYGKKCGAYPDGRLAGDQFSKNLMPVFGCDRRGLLAYLNSVTKIDAEDYPNGAPIDFILHPTAVEGEEGLDVMLSLIRTTFKKGGSAAQCGVYSAELLRDAQEHPELYRGLQVRLCGWSQYFDKLTRDEQDMLIRQAESREG